MADCCSSGQPRNHHRCPVNGKAYREVPAATVAHHVRAPWRNMAPDCRYFFCDDPDCEVVYFGDDGSVIPLSTMRTRVGAKDRSASATLCYCFGATRAEVEADPAVREFILRQTREGQCSCETRNPSGRCCLKDLPRPGTVEQG